MLTPAERARYEAQGYVIPALRLPEAEVEALRRACEYMMAANPDLRPENLMNPHMAPWPEGENPFLVLAHDARIVGAVASLLGEDLVLWVTRILAKLPEEGMEVPWHQDGRYWPIRPLATCSVWIALDAATPGNGCMRFLPGSHRGAGLLPHRSVERDDVVLKLELEPGAWDPEAAVDVVLEPGQMSLHDVRLAHGSRANRSRQRRAALILRYFPGTSVFERGIPDPDGQHGFAVSGQPLWLVRGRDRSGRNDFRTGHDVWRARYAHMASTAAASPSP